MRLQYKEHLAGLYDHVMKSAQVLPFVLFLEHGSKREGDHLVVTVDCQQDTYSIVDSIELPSPCEECPYTAPNGKHFGQDQEIPWEDVRWEIISALTTLYSKGYLWNRCPLSPTDNTRELLYWDDESRSFTSALHPHDTYSLIC